MTGRLRNGLAAWFDRPADARIAWPDVVLAVLVTAAVQFWVVQRDDYWVWGPRWLIVLVAWTPLFVAVRRLDPALALGGLLVGAYGMSLLAGSIGWPLFAGALLAAWYLPKRWGTVTGLVLAAVLTGLPVLADLARADLVYRVYPNVYTHFASQDGSTTTIGGITEASFDRVLYHHWPWWASVAVLATAVLATVVQRRRGVVPVRRTTGQWVEDLQAAARPRIDGFPVQVLVAVALAVPVLVELTWDIGRNGNWWTAPRWMPWAIAFTPLTLVVRRRWPVIPIAVLGVVALVSYWQTNEVWSLLLALTVALLSLGTSPRPLTWTIPGAIVVLAALPTIAELIRYRQMVWIFPRIKHDGWDFGSFGEIHNRTYEDIVDRQWPLTWSLILLVPLCAGIAVRLYRRNREAARREVELERVAVEREAEQVVLTERSYIARDLHDVVAHAVNLMVIQAETGPDLIRRGEADVLAGFQRIGDAGRRALSELDRLLSALRDEDGVPDPQLAPQPDLGDLSQLVTDVSEGHLPIALEVTGDSGRPPQGQQLATYRLVQEALTNVVRHATATAARVLVRIEETGVRVEVTDDGSGFDVAAAARGTRHGLAGMRERVRIEGGTLDIRSTPGTGTTVAAWFPAGGGR
ncbi:ATP-binding protein [Kribbella sp. NPDC000426]|uniref:sensor histidine kinase n=1 Tax=Kribbella sp. NPDC000426 TaxID=3154255 RepID=UPI003332C302